MGAKVQANYLGAGSVIQYVEVKSGAVVSSNTTIPTDDTIPQQSEGTEWLTLSITPKSATSILKVDVNAVWDANSAVAAVTFAMFRDAGADAVAAVKTSSSDGAGAASPVNFSYSAVSGSTASTTFKVRFGYTGSGVTLYVNGNSSGTRYYGGVSASSIRIWEIAA